MEKDKLKKEQYFRNFRNWLFAAGLPILFYTVIGPLEIYTGNIQEFHFRITDFLWIFIAAGAAMLLLLSALLSLLPVKVQKVLQMLCLTFAVLSYLQSLLLNGRLIQSDGSRIDWSGRKWQMTWNLFFWIAGFAGAVTLMLLAGKVWKKSCRKAANLASAFLMLVQLVSVVAMLFTAGSYEYANHNYILDGARQLKLASGNNIVVFLLDRYANDEFEKLLEEEPEAASLYQDFTYYDNADSHYNYTFPSMAYLLTGQEVNPDTTREDWTRESWQSEKCQKFYKLLHENGYTCNLYSDVEAYVALGSLENVAGCFDNVVQCQPRIDRGLICRLLEKMTIYKYVPYVLKPLFEVDYNVFDQTVIYDREDGTIAFQNSEFYEKLCARGLSVDTQEQNAYQFIHLSGLHGPYHTNADGSYAEEADKNAARQGIQVMLSEYIEQLKAIGKYEDTVILITSDHGMDHAEREPQPLYLLKEAADRAPEKKAADPKGTDAAADTLAGATDYAAELKVNSAPVSAEDYPATILALAGIAQTDYGTSIYDWNPDSTRTRQLLYPYTDKEIRCYTYTGNRDDLKQKMEAGDFEILTTAFDWHW